MTGTGNDFIVFDNRNGRWSGRERAFFASICRRHESIGADGVVLIERGGAASIRMRYYNRDGREAPMCGNAARCAALYAVRKGMVRSPSFVLEASDGAHPVRVAGRRTVTVRMRPAEGYGTGLGIVREPEFSEGGFIDTGVPHWVVFVPAAERVALSAVAPYYRHHPAFPEGANVNFVEVRGGNRIAVRTFERGVEDETLSCGTGCVASALIVSRTHGYSSPVRVETRGGILTVAFDEEWRSIDLTGSAEVVYEGVLEACAVCTRQRTGGS